MMKTIQVTYFGMLSAQAGMSEETVSTDAETLAQLYQELTDARSLKLSRDSVRVAQADEFADWDAGLDDGAEIAFMPPFCGG